MADRILKTLFVSTFSVMLGLGIISPLMPMYAQNMGATGIWLGLIFSGFSFSRFVFMPIVGKLSDRYGRKKFIVTGLFFITIVSVLYTYAEVVFELVAVRIVHGVFSAMVLPIAMAYVGETSEDGSEGKAMGTYNIALFFGMATGPLLGGLLYDSYGIKSVFHTMALLSGFAFCINIIFLPDIQKNVQSGQQKQASFKSIFSNKTFQAIFIFRAINALARGGMMAFLPIYAHHLGLGSVQIGILISVNVFLTALLQRRFGMLSDRLNSLMMVFSGSLVTSIALGLIPLGRNFTGLIILGMITGISSAWSMPAATSINIKLGKSIGSMGATVGLFNTAQSLGMISAPLISGVVMDLLGIQYVFIVIALICLIGTGFFLVLLTHKIKERK